MSSVILLYYGPVFSPPTYVCTRCKEFSVHSTTSSIVLQNIIITAVLETGFFCSCPLHGKPHIKTSMLTMERTGMLYILKLISMFTTCCCCLHIKSRSGLYSVLSNIRTGPTDADAFRGHRLTTQKGYTYQKEIKRPRKVNTHAIIGK